MGSEFPVQYEELGEMIPGLDDRHFDFRIGILSDGATLRISNWVRSHNLAGGTYAA